MAGLLGMSIAGALASLLFATATAIMLSPKANTGAAAAAVADASTAVAAVTADTSATPIAAGATRQAALLSVSAFAAVAPLALTKFDPSGCGELMAIPAGLAWSLFGFLAGKAMSLNPMLVAAAAANTGMYWYGRLMGQSYSTAMAAYFGQVSTGQLAFLARMCTSASGRHWAAPVTQGKENFCWFIAVNNALKECKIASRPPPPTVGVFTSVPFVRYYSA